MRSLAHVESARPHRYPKGNLSYQERRAAKAKFTLELRCR